MTTLSYLTSLPWLPMSIERRGRPSNGELRRWCRAGNVLVNGRRMQEEIGTGGAGFRFLYAAFLQEAGEKLNRADLLKASLPTIETFSQIEGLDAHGRSAAIRLKSKG